MAILFRIIGIKIKTLRYLPGNLGAVQKCCLLHKKDGEQGESQQNKEMKGFFPCGSASMSPN